MEMIYQHLCKKDSSLPTAVKMNLQGMLTLLTEAEAALKNKENINFTNTFLKEVKKYLD